MTKFKVGDKVVITDISQAEPSPDFRKKMALTGDNVFTVSEVKETYVEIDGYKQGLYKNGIELYKAPETGKRKKHTYKATYTRSDGVVFSNDSIETPYGDTRDLEEAKREIVNLRKRARELQGLIKSHKALFSKSK